MYYRLLISCAVLVCAGALFLLIGNHNAYVNEQGVVVESPIFTLGGALMLIAGLVGLAVFAGLKLLRWIGRSSG